MCSYRKARARLSSEEHSGRRRGNRHRLQHRKFQQTVTKKVLQVKAWKRLLEMCVYMYIFVPDFCPALLGGLQTCFQ